MEIKSELVMCPRGHYYNAAVHASCPICGGSGGFGGGVGATEPFGGAGGIGATEPFGGAGGVGATEPFGGGMGGFSSTEAPGGMGGGMGGFSSTEAPGGMGGGMGGFSSTEAPGGMGGGMGGFSSTEAPGGMGGGMGGFSATEAPGAIRGGGGPGSFAPTEAPGGWGGGSPGPVNPFSVQTTIGGDSVGPQGFKPVVGWLVCIDGPSRGTEWRIHAGYNYIGREVGDIHIQGDTQISREKHALVAYYAKTRSYFVGPAEGRNIVELNEGPVFNTMPLKNYDIITIGTTKLMFVGLCGDHFSWSEVADNA